MQAAISSELLTRLFRASPEQMAAVERVLIGGRVEIGKWENRNGARLEGRQGVCERNFFPVLPGNVPVLPDASWSGLEPGLEREKGVLWSPRACERNTSRDQRPPTERRGRATGAGLAAGRWRVDFRRG
jgi:hypothetical protein